MEVSKESLDKVMKEKVKPVIDDAMQKYLGVTINEIGRDITDKIEKNQLIGYEIHTELAFKTAKKLFKKEFLIRILRNHFGNISSAAKIAGLDRRSLHRDIISLGIEVDKMRKEMVKTSYYQKEAVDSIIKETLDDYKAIIRPSKLEGVYKNIEKISSEIIKELPSIEMMWKDAEAEFEKIYLKRILEESKGNASIAAKRIGIRYETLHRKIKKLGIA